MTALHTEKALEDEICHDLAAADWLHDPDAAARYDRALALFPDDVVGWIQTTQPEAWSSIEQTHGANARKVVCERLCEGAGVRSFIALPPSSSPAPPPTLAGGGAPLRCRSNPKHDRE